MRLDVQWCGNEAITYLYSCCSALADGLWYIGSQWINEGHQAHKTQPSNGKVELCIIYRMGGMGKYIVYE